MSHHIWQVIHKNRKHDKGPNIDPCGTPTVTEPQADRESSNVTACWQPHISSQAKHEHHPQHHNEPTYLKECHD